MKKYRIVERTYCSGGTLFVIQVRGFPFYTWADKMIWVTSRIYPGILPMAMSPFKTLAEAKNKLRGFLGIVEAQAEIVVYGPEIGKRIV